MGTAIGVAIGVRYRSITRFLMPAIFISLSFDLPVLWYLEILPSPWMYAWPAMPPVIFAKAAFLDVEGWQLAYAGAYGGVAVFLAVLLGRSAMRRFVDGGSPG